jgi:hypothetical protein
MEQEKILDKLQKIKNMAEGAKAIGNEAEAQAFAAMLQQLMLKHKLSMTDIQYAAEMKDEPIVEQRAPRMYKGNKQVYVEFPDVEVVKRRRLWAEELAMVIAEAYASRILVTEGWSMITFVGHKSNVQIAEYLFLTLLRSADKMSNTAAKSFRAKYRSEVGGAGMTPNGYRESWLDGFVTRIAQRLREERDQFGKKADQCTALVRVNKEAIAVKAYIDGKHAKMAKSLNQGKNFNPAGWAEGKKAANDMNIKGNAVNAGDGPNKQLK